MANIRQTIQKDINHLKTDRTTDPDGWFYKTYDRVIYGDERVQHPRRNLSDGREVCCV